MLKESRESRRPSPVGRVAVTAGVLAVLGTGLLVAGLRSPGTTETARTTGDDTDVIGSTEVDDAKPATAAKGVDLSNIPRDAIFMWQFDVEGLLGNPDLGRLKKEIAVFEDGRLQFGVPVSSMRRFSISMVPSERNGERNITKGEGHPLFVVHTKDDIDVEAFREAGHFEADGEAGGVPLYSHLRDRVALSGPRTVVSSNDAETVGYAIRQGDGANRAVWAEDAKRAGDAHAMVFANVAALRSDLGANALNLQPATSGLAMMAPFYNNVNTVAAGVRLDKALTVRAYVSCVSEEGAEEVLETAKAMLVLGRNWVKQARLVDLARAPREQRAMLDEALALVTEMIDSMEFTRKGELVEIVGRTKDVQVGALVAALLPAVRSARAAARRTQATNNLKQIALAMHNYHDAHGHLPPAVLTGQDGKTKHSWRVAILPYIGHVKLYGEYAFDEPWDSETNKKVLAKMPEVLRDPNEPEGSTNSSYFALVGKRTAFDPAFNDGKGTRFRDMTDGTSNSLLVVSAKRKIPWTKPEDIPVDVTAEKLPTLGGYHANLFLAALCDGSVKAIALTIDPKVLRNLMGVNDGNVIPSF